MRELAHPVKGKKQSPSPELYFWKMRWLIGMCFDEKGPVQNYISENALDRAILRRRMLIPSLELYFE